MLGIEKFINERTKRLETRQGTISDDLYGSIKEVAELKYRMVEYETKLANLTAMVKILGGKVG